MLQASSGLCRGNGHQLFTCQPKCGGPHLYAIRMLRSAQPRRLDSGYERRPILVFTDGCWEAGHAGIGAIMVDAATGRKVVCSGVVPELAWPLEAICWGLHHLPD